MNNCICVQIEVINWRLFIGSQGLQNQRIALAYPEKIAVRLDGWDRDEFATPKQNKKKVETGSLKIVLDIG